MGESLETLKEIIAYFRKTKKWWLIPAALLIIIAGLLILIASVSPVPLFLYPLI